MFRRSLIIGAVFALTVILFSEYDERVFAGLVAGLAVALYSALRRRESWVRSNAQRTGILTSVVFVVAFWLAHPDVLGSRTVAVVAGSFAIAGILSLLATGWTIKRTIER